MSTFWESGTLIWLRPILFTEEKTIFKHQLGIAKKALNARLQSVGSGEPLKVLSRGVT